MRQSAASSVRNGTWLHGESEAYDIEFAAAIVYRHVPALAEVLAIGEELAHEFLQRVASLLEYASLSVLDEYDVFG
jgi:hypothetical protein